MPTERLGGAAPQRDLHFIFLADCSGSMAGAKIAALNAGIEGAIGPMRQVVATHADVRVLVRAIRFSDKASWHVVQETPLEQFTWPELTAGGTTATGEAILLALSALDKLVGRQLPPVLVLVSDGQATDAVAPALEALANHKWGKRAVRRAVAIGDDADTAALQEFIGDPEIQPTLASRPEDIAAAMRFVSVGSLSKASVGKDAVTPPTGTPPVQVPGASSSGQSGSMPPSVF
jgi:uncharacterized protein YegL